jgi:hypothetical protein
MTCVSHQCLTQNYILFLLFIYLHVHTLFGSFFPLGGPGGVVGGLGDVEVVARLFFQCMVV